MKKQWKHPFWENYQKDRITCKLVIQHDDGKESSSTARIFKYTNGGKINPDWEEILKQNDTAVIDKNTEEREERHRKRRESEVMEKKERDQARKLEELFNAKLEVFEIDSIKSSTNRKMKARMRKSKNRYELLAYTVMLLKEEIDNEQSV